MPGRILSLAVVVLLAFVPIGQAADHPGKKVFHGKRFDEWVRDLRHADSKVRGRAAMALGLGPFGKPAVESLIKALKDRDREVRFSAVVALSYLGPDAVEAIPQLERLLKDASHREKCEVFNTFGCIGPPALPALMEQLRSGGRNFPNCLALSAALGRIGAEALPPLTASLRDLSPGVVKIMALFGCFSHERNGAALLPAVRGLLKDPDQEVREEALSVFIAIGEPALPDLAELLTDEKLGRKAAEGLAKMGDPGYQTLRKAVSHRNLRVRTNALLGLKEGNADVFALLASGLKDPDPRIRGAAAESLSVLNAHLPAAIPTLLSAASDRDPVVRKRVVLALTRIYPPDPRALQSAGQGLQDRNGEVRRGACERLGELGGNGQRAAHFVIHALRHWRENRGLAAATLGRIGRADEASVRALCEALGDREAEVRERAAWALGLIGPQVRKVTMVCGDPGIGSTRAGVAVLSLLRALRDRERPVKVTAAHALWRIGYREEAIVKLLARELVTKEESSGLDDERWVAAGKAVLLAANALGEIGAPAKTVLPILVQALDDPDRAMRTRALDIICNLAPAVPEAIPILTRVLAGKDTEHSEKAAQALTEMGGKGIPALEHALAEKRLHPTICEALSRFGHPDQTTPGPARQRLFAALAAIRRGPDPDLACQARRAAIELGYLDEEIVREVAAHLQDRDYNGRARGCYLLGRLGRAASPAVPLLVRVLLDREADLRCMAASTLGRVGPEPAVVAGLVDALTDREASVRLATLDALLPLGPAAARALPSLRVAVKDADHQVRARAALACWKIGGRKEKAIPVLETLLTDRNALVRAEAARALWQIERRRRVIPILIRLLWQDAGSGRDIASATLKEIGPEAREFLPVLLPLLEDKCLDVRKAAVEVFRSIDPKRLQALGYPD
jgi:HEAT repeat protein